MKLFPPVLLALALLAAPALALPKDVSFGVIKTNTNTTGDRDFQGGCAHFVAYGTWWSSSPSAILQFSPDGGTTWIPVDDVTGSDLDYGANDSKVFCRAAAPLRVVTTGSTGTLSIAASVQYIATRIAVGLGGGGGDSLAEGGTVAGELIVNNTVNPIQTWQLSGTDLLELKSSGGNPFHQSTTGTYRFGAAAGDWYVTSAGLSADSTIASKLDVGPGAITLEEMTAPSAPAANSVVVYAVDSGGKTALMALFPTGVAQQVAIEP